ncbi:MAG: Fur family transcriptional regulator [Anaerolineae bacterium]
METDNRFQNDPVGHAGTRDRLLAALIAAGHSSTAPRRAVIDTLASAEASLCPQDILERSRERHPTLGLVTVYRTLEILTALGLVRRIHQDGDCHSYVVIGRPHGHHLLCENCRQAIEFEGCELDHLFERVREQTGFRISDHWLELFGLCPACQAREKASDR